MSVIADEADKLCPLGAATRTPSAMGQIDAQTETFPSGSSLACRPLRNAMLAK